MKKKELKRLICFILITLFIISAFVSAKDSDASKAAVNKPKVHPLGLKKLHEKIPGMEMAQKIYRASGSVPAAVDLSNKLPSPGDQDQLGSCIAWAVAYAYKSYQEGIDHNWSTKTIDHQFSPAFIYNQIHLNNAPDGGGAYFSGAFSIMKYEGCTTLKDMPYNGSLYGYTQFPTKQQSANAAKFKVKNWSRLADGDYNEVRAHLAGGDAVVIGLPVYPDFEAISSENPIYDDASGESRGGHALCIIGYDDSKKAVKFINSWSTDWGLDGYGWMSYELIAQLQCELFVMTDINDPPMPTPTPIPVNTNLAKGKIARASAALSSHSAAKVVDGDRSSFWVAEAEVNQWINVLMGSQHTVNAMNIKWSTYNYPNSFDIQAWNGKEWYTVKTMKGHGGLQKIPFSPSIKSSSFRILCYCSNSCYFTMYEWEIYGN